MATISEPRDFFVNELNSMLYVEQQLANEALPTLAKEIQNEEFKQGVEHHQEETERHVQNLERVFELLGEEPKPDKNHVVDGLIAQHQKVAKHIERGHLRDIYDAGAAAKTEHLEIASYESLIATAESLGEDEVVSLLEENLEQEQKTLKQVQKISEQLTKDTAAAY